MKSNVNCFLMKKRAKIFCVCIQIDGANIRQWKCICCNSNFVWRSDALNHAASDGRRAKPESSGHWADGRNAKDLLLPGGLLRCMQDVVLQ